MVPIWTAMATASPANPMLGNAENDVGLQLAVGPICRNGLAEYPANPWSLSVMNRHPQC